MQVVLSVQAPVSDNNDGGWSIWGDRFCKLQPPSIRKHILVPQKPTVSLAKAKLLEAIRTAGPSGELILNVGHGIAASEHSGAAVDIAPDKVMRLGDHSTLGVGLFLDIFYDVKFGGQSQLEHDLENNPTSPQLAHWNVYKEIADACARTKLYRVFLLTCRVGNSLDFIQKIALDWNVIVVAYRRRVKGVVFSFPNTKLPPRFIVILEGDPEPPTLAAQTVFAEEGLPQSDMVFVGPPIP